MLIFFLKFKINNNVNFDESNGNDFDDDVGDNDDNPFRI
jgi:hypothetical protein